MTAKTIASHKLVHDMINLMQEEVRALASRKFKSLHDLVARKAQFAEALSALLSENSSAALDSRLIVEVRNLQALAAVNAAQIKSLRDGVARARASLEKIANAKDSAGVYDARGQFLGSGKQGSRCRDA